MSIEIPGRRQATGNPLVVLNEQLGHILTVLQGMYQLMASDGVGTHHHPGVSQQRDGTWGVFCIGCSAQRQEFTYPCLVTDSIEEWPPATLITVPPGPESTLD